MYPTSPRCLNFVSLSLAKWSHRERFPVRPQTSNCQIARSYNELSGPWSAKPAKLRVKDGARALMEEDAHVHRTRSRRRSFDSVQRLAICYRIYAKDEIKRMRGGKFNERFVFQKELSSCGRSERKCPSPTTRALACFQKRFNEIQAFRIVRILDEQAHTVTFPDLRHHFRYQITLRCLGNGLGSAVCPRPGG